MKDMVGQRLNIQLLQKEVVSLWNKDNESARELGKALITLRDAMKDAHGNFAQWFKDSGLAKNRVYYCIRLAEGKIANPQDEDEEESKPREQPSTEFLLTTEVWQLLSRHAANRGISPIVLAQQICVPAITAWLDGQVPFTEEAAA
jgi:hypothetical protein